MDTLQDVKNAIIEESGVEAAEGGEELANFVCHLHEEASSLNDFRASLEDAGAEFPEEFITKVFYALRHTKKKNTAVKKEEQEPVIPKKEPAAGANFLSLPNDDIPIKREQTDIKDLINDFKHEDDLKPHIKNRVRSRSPPSRVKKEYRNRDTHRTDLVIGQIYPGTVARLVKFGAFVRIDGSGKDGLVHLSAITDQWVEHPSDVLKENQEVYVRVVEIKPDGKISLNMKDVDQYTGETIQRKEPEQRGRSYEVNNEPTKRMTSSERWEIRQLIASGAVSAKDYPGLMDEERDDSSESHNPDEEIDIEVKQTVPPFLAGVSLDLHKAEPAKVVSIPEGSLARAAVTGSALAKERREKKLKEMKEERDRKLKEKTLQSSRANDDPLVNGEVPEEDVVEYQRRKNKNVEFGKRDKMSLPELRKTLPVYQVRDQLIQKIKENQFVVIVGETGSGKTTQLTQYLNECGFYKNGIIGCTQPRRVAATSVAQRVAQEMGVRLGREVGYNVRFDDNSSEVTRIKYMTDGMLQREAVNDPDMSKYSVVMLDEAHERTVATDILFALLKKAAVRRPDLKVIVTSATLDANKFSKYFNDCPIMEIPGRTFPVEIMYTNEPEADYLAGALDTVVHIHVSEAPGDILVFLTGADEIETSAEVLKEKVKSLGDSAGELIILPIYSSLPAEMQSKIFEPTPPGSRKVILATNIAETSLTIDGIFYVVDPGFAKMSMYDPKLGIDTLTVKPISRAQANQRAGRAGRTGPGKCYRLYTELAFKEEMIQNTIPEIQRQNLSNTILMLKAIGINDLINFEFMDPPSTESIMLSLNDLYYLRAVDDDSRITSIGRNLVNIPADPKISKTLIESIHYKCSDDMITIFAMLTTPNIFFRPKNEQEQADKAKARFHHPHGDHLTYLNVYRQWITNGCKSTWCRNNYLQEKSLNSARRVRDQLVDIFKRNKYPLISCDRNTNAVRKALCSGYFRNVAKRDQQEGYKTLEEGTQVFIHPGSSLRSSPQYVLYDTIRNTTKEYMNHVTTVEPQWLVEMAPEFFEANGSKTQAKRKAEKIVPLFNRFTKDQDDWRLSGSPGAGSGKKRFRA